MDLLGLLSSPGSTRLDSVDAVDAFSAQLYAGHHKAAAEHYASGGWKAVFDACGGVQAMLTILEQTASPYSILLCCQTLSDGLRTIVADISELEQLFQAVVGIYRRRWTDWPEVGKRKVQTFVGVVLQSGYAYSPMLQALPTTMALEAMQLVAGGCTGRTVGDASVLCELLTAIMEEISSSSLEHMASDHCRAKHFEEIHLLVLWRCGIVCLKATAPAGDPVGAHLHAVSIALVRGVLEFDGRRGTWRTDEDAADGRRHPFCSGPVSSEWQHALVDRAAYQRLWQLFCRDLPASESGASSPRRQLVSILFILTHLVSLHASCFNGQEAERGEWLSTALLQTHLIMDRQCHLEDGDVTLAFVGLLAAIKPAYRLDDLMKTQWYAAWLSSCCRLTLLQLEFAHGPSISLRPACLALWAGLCGASAYATAPGDGLKELAKCAELVLQGLWQLMEKRVTAYVMGDGEDYMLEDDVEGMEEEWSYALQIVGGCEEVGWRWLQQSAGAVLSAMHDCLVRDAAALVSDNPPAAVTVEMAAWVLHLIRLAAKATVTNDHSILLLTLGIQLMYTDSRTQAGGGIVDQLPPRVRAHWEAAMLTLAHGLHRSSLLANLSAVSKTVVRQVCDQLAQSAIPLPQHPTLNALPALLVEIILRVVWRTMNAANVDAMGRMEALQLMEEIATGGGAIAVRQVCTQLGCFLSLDPSEVPRALTLAEAARARRWYARWVARMAFVDVSSEGHRRLLQAIFTPLEVQLADLHALLTQSQVRVEAIRGPLLLLLADCRGVLSCATQRVHYQLVLDRLGPCMIPLMDLVLPAKPDSATTTTTLAAMVDEPIATQWMKLLMELTTNTNQRLTFDRHSCQGMALFRLVSAGVARGADWADALVQLHGQTSTLSATSSTSADGALGKFVEWGWKLTRIILETCARAIQAEYCSLGMLKLFHDSALEALLASSWTLLQQLTVAEAAMRPKVRMASLAYLRELTMPSLAWWWRARNPADVQRVWGVVEATAFPTHPTGSTLESLCLGLLEQLTACLYVLPHAATQERKESSAQWMEIMKDADGDRLHRLTTCSVELALGTKLDAPLAKLLARLILVEGDGLQTVAAYYVSRSKHPGEVQRVFDQLQSAAVELMVQGATGDALDLLRQPLQNAMEVLRPLL